MISLNSQNVLWYVARESVRDGGPYDLSASNTACCWYICWGWCH